MTEENFDRFQNEFTKQIKKQENEDVLEISSTGYGLESVKEKKSKKNDKNITN